ncbi:DNA repair protein rad10 [Gloeophyllum trabeum ATCC 11539]|uniref:DNA repair protein rad10 n=1 Tax=Gloeophyllum trabeum (strain ATCC 11539 / FP-39264 / Madison 617) TaxID=670483 RepID=S7QDJ3_GLOTA|nr:DNA repair protein rad10 [Gloeophyllum trabeum ATCC 11539]EPQ57397.1 DNA repair protein rad10 [Gloeophyllum trabeum ATCC 11539]
MSAAPATAGSSSSRPPVKPPVVQPGTGNNIIVNPCQRLNPVLEHIRNVGKEFGDIVPDFQVGRTTGVLFLSLKYHRLHPEYIHTRIERLGHSYNLRILLLMCDVSEHQDPIRELTKVCLINNITIIVAWSPEEAGAYLATYKQFEHRPPDMIKERVEKDHLSLLRTALTSISKVNKTDVETLRTSIGSFADIARASSTQLQALPGFGQVKVRRMKDAFERPFRNSATSILSYTTSQPRASQNDKGEEKGKEPTVPDRDPSVLWDDDIDLGDFTTPAPEPRPPPVNCGLVEKEPQKDADAASQRRKRPPSPVWDIELDLNPSDLDEGDAPNHPSKRRREEVGFGTPTGVL